MGLFGRIFPAATPTPSPSTQRIAMPRVAAGDGGVLIRTPQELEEALKSGGLSASGQAVNADTAMRQSAVYACVRIIAGAVATLPLHIKRRVDDRTRLDASDLALWRVLRRRPNPWQKPAQFRRMLQAHVLLRGNGYARIVRNPRGDVQQLLPLHPDRVETRQRDDLALEFVYTRKNGGQQVFQQTDILHLVGLTLDGITGVTPIKYARETIGLAMAQEEHGANVFRNGGVMSGKLSHPGRLGEDGVRQLSDSLEQFRAGGAKEGRALVLEEGMTYERMALTSEDAQWIESRKFSRSEIAMFFGVPPHMIGDTEKSTSWGTGIEQQSQGFVTYTLEDHLTMWEEAVTCDCIPDSEPDLYARFNRNALVRGDIKARWDAYVKALQWGVYSPNRVLELEDENPRDGGDIYYDPPNTAGGDKPDDDDDRRPPMEEDL